MKAKNLAKKRYGEIDFLRGSAVFFMLITHISAVFLDGSDFVLDNLSWFGATICFTAFLFCFAFVYGLKFSRRGRVDTKKQIKRALIILFVYYLSALSAHFFIFNDFGRGVAWKIISLQYLPMYTEFIIAFVGFIILILLSQSILKFLLKFPVLFILLSLGIYFLSVFLYQLNLGQGYLDSLKALLVGAGHIHSFGILSYFPVFVLGLIWGYLQTNKNKQNYLYAFLISCLVVFLILKLGDFSTWYRFPPSMLFLLYGILYCFGIVLLYRYIKKAGIIDRFFLFLGKNALFIFIANVIVILGISLFINYAKFSGFYTWLWQIAIISTISLATYIYVRLVTLAKK